MAPVRQAKNPLFLFIVKCPDDGSTQMHYTFWIVWVSWLAGCGPCIMLALVLKKSCEVSDSNPVVLVKKQVKGLDQLK